MPDPRSELVDHLVRRLDQIELPPRDQWRPAPREESYFMKTSRYVLYAGAVAAVLFAALLAGNGLRDRNVQVATSPSPIAATGTPPSPTPSIGVATVAPTATSAGGVIAASHCTSVTAATRQVVDRLFALSTSNDPAAVNDCFAQPYRDKNLQFAAGSELWSHSGPANDLVVTLVDTVRGCDRFSVTAQMPNNRFWNGAPQFYTVGPEAGGPRIYETGTALVNATLATTRCPSSSTLAPGTFENPAVGYRIRPPDGYRSYATLLVPGPDGVGVDFFTLRTDAQERELCVRQKGSDLPARETASDLQIRVVSNPSEMSAVDYASAPVRRIVFTAIQPTTVNGYEAARIMHQPSGDTSWYVIRANDRFYEISPGQDEQPSQLPKGWLDQIVATFNAFTPDAFPPAVDTRTRC